MARSIWTGTVSFGLVSIPIKLFSATESHRVSFHEFEVGTGQRIHHKRVAEKSNREVPWDKIQKGFEIGKGRYVMLTDAEMATAEPRKSGTIDIEQFVSLEDIDPVNWDQTYYVGPDGSQSAKAYNLLRQAMTERKRVAIGRFVMRTKEYVICIRPFENILALQTMFFADEVRRPKELGIAPASASVSRPELTMAVQLIESLTAPWDATKFKDTYSKRVLDLVRKKDKGHEIEAAPRAEKEGKVLDLMAALKATLAGGRKNGAPGRTDPGTSNGHDKSKTRTAAKTTGRQARGPKSKKAGAALRVSRASAA